MNRSTYAFLLIVIVFLSCSEVSSSKIKTVDTPIDEPVISNAVSVEVFAEQFKWTIRYSGENNQLGKFDYKLFTEENPLALMTTETLQTRLLELKNELLEMDSMSLHAKVPEGFMKKYRKNERLVLLLEQMNAKHDPAIDKLAQDDLIISDTLVLCVDQEYDFRFRSKDVIHSAYFPHFRAQMNTVPGMTNRFKLTPSETTLERQKKGNDDDFEFMLRCNKVCGAGHESMKMVVRIVEKEECDLWMKSNETNLFKNRQLN